MLGVRGNIDCFCNKSNLFFLQDTNNYITCFKIWTNVKLDLIFLMVRIQEFVATPQVVFGVKRRKVP